MVCGEFLAWKQNALCNNVVILDWNKNSQFSSPLSVQKINAYNIPNFRQYAPVSELMSIYKVLYNLVAVRGKHSSYGIWFILIHMRLLKA